MRAGKALPHNGMHGMQQQRACNSRTQRCPASRHSQAVLAATNSAGSGSTVIWLAGLLGSTRT